MKTGTRRLDLIVDHMTSQYRRAAARPDWHPVFTADYRWEHSQRVAHYGDRIAESERVDRELCVAACLLHDIAYFHIGEEGDWKEHGRIGAELSRPVLNAAGFSAEETEVIAHAIAVHVDGEAGFPHPHTPVADVVSDADNVDRFSALRVVLWCMAEHRDLEKLAAMVRERVARLRGYQEKNPLKTAAGRRLFARQVDRQLAFFQAILEDTEVTRLPDLSPSPSAGGPA